MPDKTMRCESHDELVEVQALVNKLKHANRLLKEIPSLPKGKLRDHIEDEVNGIIRYDASPLKEKLKSIDTFLITVNDCYRLCVEIKNASAIDKKVKLPPNLLDSVQKIISEAHTILGFKGTFS
jgi:hypothetical protein